LLFRHSGLDPESSFFKRFWMPAFAGMTGATHSSTTSFAVITVYTRL